MVLLYMYLGTCNIVRENQYYTVSVPVLQYCGVMRYCTTRSATAVACRFACSVLTELFSVYGTIYRQLIAARALQYREVFGWVDNFLCYGMMFISLFFRCSLVPVYCSLVPVYCTMVPVIVHLYQYIYGIRIQKYS